MPFFAASGKEGRKRPSNIGEGDIHYLVGTVFAPVSAG